MMTEVLTDWTALLKKFQGEEYSLMTMDKDIESFDFKVTLEYIKGESLRSTNFALLKNEITNSRSFLSKHQFVWNAIIEMKLVKQFKEFCSGLLTNVRERFPHKDLIYSMHVFKLDALLNIETDDDEKLVDFGRKEMMILGEHFGRIKVYKTSSSKRDYLPGIISKDDLTVEYSHFKYMIYLNFGGDKRFCSLSNQEKWHMLFRLYPDRFPNLLMLAKIVFTIPASTVACERLFSQKNLIKNRTRNSLKTKTIDMLLRVSLFETKEFQTQHREIIDLFLSSKTRFELKYRAKVEISSGKICSSLSLIKIFCREH
jgi:hypothetical protein